MFLYSSVPNPPGPIEVLLVTTSSINIMWTQPHLMRGTSFQYRLNIGSPHADVVNVTDIMAENHTFHSLPSGTPFNISVQTVGIMMFVSEKAQIRTVTTSEELTLPTKNWFKVYFAIHCRHCNNLRFLIAKDRLMWRTSWRHLGRNPSLRPGQNP